MTLKASWKFSASESASVLFFVSFMRSSIWITVLNKFTLVPSVGTKGTRVEGSGALDFRSAARLEVEFIREQLAIDLEQFGERVEVVRDARLRGGR